MRRNPEIGQDSSKGAPRQLRNAVYLAEIPPDSEKAALRLVWRQPLSSFRYGDLVAIQSYYRGAGGEEGFAVPSTAKCAIQNFTGAGKERHHFINHNRRMVGAIPPAGCGVRHLQKRFISLSTAGVNCGIAVSS